MSAAPFPRSFTPAEAQSSISSFWVCRSLSYCLRLLACHLRVLATRSHLGACVCVRTHGKSAHDNIMLTDQGQTSPHLFSNQAALRAKRRQPQSSHARPLVGASRCAAGLMTLARQERMHTEGYHQCPPPACATQNARCTPARHTHGQCKHRNRWVAEQGAPHGHVPAPPCRHHPPRPRCPGCCLRCSQAAEQRRADCHRTSWYDRRFVDAFDPWVFTSS